MSDTSDPTPAPAAQPDPAPEPASPPAPDPSEDTTDWKAEARKWEDRAKANKKAADELEKQRKATMTEAERAAVEAEQKGRQAAVAEFGARLARTEFDAIAARRNPEFDTAGALEFVDLSRFVGEDGEPDKKAIQQAVERIVPAPIDGPPSFDGGPRTPPPPAPAGMNTLIRKATGRA